MPVQVETMTSEVAATAGDIPLSDAQLERLVALVMQRLAAKQQGTRAQKDATQLRPTAAPRPAVRDLRDSP
jgi:hypothetical protein